VPGSESHVDPEIHELCLKLHMEDGWGYPKIAQHLFKERGIANDFDPTRPVHRATIGRWIVRANETLAPEREHRYETEVTNCDLEFEKVKEMVFGLLNSGAIDQDNKDDVIRWATLWLEIRRERSKTYGLYAPKRKEVTVRHGGVHPRDLDPKGEWSIADFEKFLRDETSQPRERNAS
jgi:hypothetical protein